GIDGEAGDGAAQRTAGADAQVPVSVGTRAIFRRDPGPHSAGAGPAGDVAGRPEHDEQIRAAGGIGDLTRLHGVEVARAAPAAVLRLDVATGRQRGDGA